MSTSLLKSRQATRSTGAAARRLAVATKTVGGIFSCSALALGSARFYRVSSSTLGPGAFLLSIPKILGGALAPFSAVAGAVGAAFGLSALWLERRKVRGTTTTQLGVLAGLTAATMNAVHTRQLIGASGNFAAAFGADWQDQIPSRLKDRMLTRRWTWHLSLAPGTHVERDIAFAIVPGTDRKLLADVCPSPVRAVNSRNQREHNSVHAPRSALAGGAKRQLEVQSLCSLEVLDDLEEIAGLRVAAWT